MTQDQLTAMDFLMGVGFEGGCFERLEKGQTKGQEALSLGFVKLDGGFTKLDGGFTKLDGGFTKSDRQSK